VQLGAVDLFVQDASFEPAGRGDGAGVDELRAPFNGKVIAVQAQAGRAVARGETLVVLESMKLEHALAAVRDGVIEIVQAVPGQQAATGQVLVTFRATEPAKS
jgi:3-methylcrotonyl-CoA carboxylase alpha subunit/geranyl-CoA carboxylase alpha subunit